MPSWEFRYARRASNAGSVGREVHGLQRLSTADPRARRLVGALAVAVAQARLGPDGAFDSADVGVALYGLQQMGDCEEVPPRRQSYVRMELHGLSSGL